MGKTNRELPLEHLEEEKHAMRWLASKGYSLEEIRDFCWRDVDEFDKIVRAKREVFFTKYDREIGAIYTDKREKEIVIQIDDERVADFFAHSRIYSYFCFPSVRPYNAWRKEASLASLFSLCEIEDICQEELQKPCISILTMPAQFDTIKVSKENIEKTKTKELAKEVAALR